MTRLAGGPHVVALHGACVDDQSLVVVMELLEVCCACLLRMLHEFSNGCFEWIFVGGGHGAAGGALCLHRECIGACFPRMFWCCGLAYHWSCWRCAPVCPCWFPPFLFACYRLACHVAWNVSVVRASRATGTTLVEVGGKSTAARCTASIGKPARRLPTVAHWRSTAHLANGAQAPLPLPAASPTGRRPSHLVVQRGGATVGQRRPPDCARHCRRPGLPARLQHHAPVRCGGCGAWAAVSHSLSAACIGC